jgi:hypothetical protein
MNAQEITDKLRAIASAEDFPSRSEELADSWTAAGYGAETIEPIVNFIEQNPDIDFGMPGALVHFVERFDAKDYENVLSASIRRKPTILTIWMLNRIINAVADLREKRRLASPLEDARRNPLISADLLNTINRLLSRI